MPLFAFGFRGRIEALWVIGTGARHVALAHVSFRNYLLATELFVVSATFPNSSPAQQMLLHAFCTRNNFIGLVEAAKCTVGAAHNA